MPVSLIELEFKNRIATLNFNRPEVHNSINKQLMDQWEVHLNKIERDPQIRSIIITGAGSKTFCSGGDLVYFASLDTRRACLEMSYRMQAINDRLAGSKKVVIAAINGQTLGGGCEIMTACHFRIAASHATFSFRQAPNGIITGWGGGKRLFKLIGKSHALRLVLTGDRIDVKQALHIGLIDQHVEPDALLSEAENLAHRIDKNCQGSIEAFLELSQISDYGDRKSVVKFETETFADLFLEDYFRNIVKKYL